MKGHADILQLHPQAKSHSSSSQFLREFMKKEKSRQMYAGITALHKFMEADGLRIAQSNHLSVEQFQLKLRSVILG